MTLEEYIQNKVESKRKEMIEFFSLFHTVEMFSNQRKSI